MNTFHLVVSSPDGDIYNGECVKLDVRGTEGELAIMAGHSPFVTAVVKCNAAVWVDEDTKMEASTEGGLLSCAKDRVTFISGTFKFLD
ncbi:MAG: F0F1 ATP synthase subunit epsilon [Clostridia bacterium]|nr:F0F1 ATP synthase subunit epsilon [Clostridia bacterium]